MRPARRALALRFLLFCVGRSARAPVPPARVPPQQDFGGRAGFFGVRPMRRACALGKRRGPIPAVAFGPWLARAARALRLPATPPARNTPALPWQGARPLTRRLRPPLPRQSGCVAVWSRARVVKLRARGLAGGCAGSPPSGPLRGVAWALHGGGLGGRPLGRPFGRVAPPAVLRVGLCLFPAFVVSGLGLRRVSRSFASVKGRARYRGGCCRP